jgi:LmbE family N-acetylglucosaminyl deacetylase
VLTHPEFQWRIVTLCRASDPERAPRFQRAAGCLGAEGGMADLDDGPEQNPLPSEQVRQAVTRLVGSTRYDLVLTHGPQGEYSYHRRHGECCRSVADLWQGSGIATRRLWMFAYEDGNRTYAPRVRGDAEWRETLDEAVWQEKHRMITDVYGFAPGTWEERTTPREEGFWCFDSPQAAAERAAMREQTR